MRKLTLYQAIQIRGRVRRKEATPEQLAKEFKMPLSFIHAIVRREIYKLGVCKPKESAEADD